MAKRNELNAGMEIDADETFGDMTFLRMKSPKTEIDEDTGERIPVALRYVVIARKQLSEEIITVPVETPLRELVAGDKVKLVNPTTNLLGFGNGNFASSYIQVFAEDIKKLNEPTTESVGTTNTPKDPKKNQTN